MYFVDRRDAGRQLADLLKHLRRADPVVLAVARGGVPVAAEVAESLDAPLEICHVSTSSRTPFADDKQPLEVDGRTVIVVDEGLVTGATARAACRIARDSGAARVILALPIAAYDKTPRLYDVADELICIHAPQDFVSVADAYAQHPRVPDAQIIELMEAAAKRAYQATAASLVSEHANVSGRPGAAEGRETQVPSGDSTQLPGVLAVPQNPIGAVVFAYGSGTGTAGARNRYVAQYLYSHGMATLLLDLLTEPSAIDRRTVFDIGLLGRRLLDASAWLRRQPGLSRLALGYFGAATGAAAAVSAAAEPGADVAAMVLLSGRPDLAGSRRLAAVAAPTLLIAGARDAAVLDLNRRAKLRMRCANQLLVVPGADNRFDDPRSLAVAVRLAEDWFTTCLSTARRPVAKKVR
jgi:putative phosphoribosyl transferase